MCQNWGISCGVDVPLALKQQHSWAMIPRIDGSGQDA